MSVVTSIKSIKSSTSNFKVYETDEDIQKFRDYLRIPSITSDDYNYVPCVDFLRREAEKLDLTFQLYYPGGPTKPIVILEWPGLIPVLPKVCLMSHMDVVDAIEEFWTYPPFQAVISDDGRIYARGSQDVKCNGMHHLAAIRYLKQEDVQLKRTILVMFLPDQENGGKYGMKMFVNTPEFKNLKIGFVFDEGQPVEAEEFDVFFAERAVWHLKFKISGTPGHGSLLIKNTVGEKIRYLIDKFSDFRAKEIRRLEQNVKLNIGDVTIVNLTMISGGIQQNTIPSEMTLCYDCRLSILENQLKFDTMIHKWMEEAGGGIDLIYERKEDNIPPTILENNEFWAGFKRAMNDLKLKISVKICPFSTDSRFLRRVGITAIGFSAINNTLPRSHRPDEFLSADVYLKGIEIWKKIIENIGNAQF